MINNILNREIYIWGIIILLFVQCTKEPEQSRIPYNNPKGDYNYSCTVNIYSANKLLEQSKLSEGKLDVDIGTEKIVLSIHPEIGYSFIMYAKDTVKDVNTHGYYFFNIDKQIIEINGVSFEIEGANKYVSSDTIYYDGLFVKDFSYGILKYKSTNTIDGTYVMSNLSFYLL